MDSLALNLGSGFAQQKYPHFIKYMGSKSKIMDFVIDGINEVFSGGAVCDLFAGSASLSGALGRQVSIVSNDIQSYSEVIADVYLNAWTHDRMPSAGVLVEAAEKKVQAKALSHPLYFDFSNQISLEEFNAVEAQHRSFINRVFHDEWHLFTKNYSGTWWSAEQCAWIDSLREVAEEYRGTPSYNLIICCLMYAMAYTSQGTGHYAQYRDAKTESSLKDILIYRRRSVSAYFARKFNDVISSLPDKPSPFNHKVVTQDYRECLDAFEGGTVYADPPYCFVHYSRFYHAIETVVRYDYPKLQVKGGGIVKGRYRDDRHQSPFCISSQVRSAFVDLFRGVQRSGSNLVLSYSNTGMITIDEVGELIAEIMPGRTAEILTMDHQHMTLGRQKDRHRDVKECLVLVK